MNAVFVEPTLEDVGNTNRITKREPRMVQVDMRVVVRYLQAPGFDEAKADAIERTRGIIPENFKLSPYASREMDGSYTVEFR